MVLVSIVVAGVFGSIAQESAPAKNPLTVLIQTLGKIDNPSAQASILRGLNASLKGKRDVPAPEGCSKDGVPGGQEQYRLAD